MELIICKNCGAKYDRNLLTCPYCEMENTEEAHRRQKSYVENYKQKAGFWSKLPEWIIGKTGNAMTRMAVLGVSLFVVILVIGFVVAKIYSATGVWRMDMEIAKLESYYEQGDYEGLREYYWSLDSTYGGSYEKYQRTVSVYSDLTWIVEMLERFTDENYVQFHTTDEIEDYVEDVIELLYDMNQMEAEEFPYEEGAAIMNFKEQLETAIEQYLPLSEEELQNAYERYVLDMEYDFDMEAQLIYERLLEGKN